MKFNLNWFGKKKSDFWSNFMWFWIGSIKEYIIASQTWLLQMKLVKKKYNTYKTTIEVAGEKVFFSFWSFYMRPDLKPCTFSIVNFKGPKQKKFD